MLLRMQIDEMFYSSIVKTVLLKKPKKTTTTESDPCYLLGPKIEQIDIGSVAKLLSSARYEKVMSFHNMDHLPIRIFEATSSQRGIRSIRYSRAQWNCFPNQGRL